MGDRCILHPGVVVGAGVAHDARHVVSAAPGGVLNIWRVDTTVWPGWGKEGGEGKGGGEGWIVGERSGRLGRVPE